MKITAMASSNTVHLIVDGKAHTIRKGTPNFITVKKLVGEKRFNEAVQAASIAGAIVLFTW